MRKLLILASLLWVNGTFAQDYCKQIKKEVTDNNTSFNYESPYKDDSPPAVRAMRSYSTGETEFDNFNLIFFIPCDFSDLLVKTAEGEMEKEETKIVIVFDDNSKITDDTIAISHDRRESGYAARMVYFPVTPQNIKNLTTKKIAKFHLAAAEATVTAEMATAIQQYIICLKDVKK